MSMEELRGLLSAPLEIGRKLPAEDARRYVDELNRLSLETVHPFAFQSAAGIGRALSAALVPEGLTGTA